MSRLTDAIDANRRGEAVPVRTQTPKNNAMGTGSREERAASRAPSPAPWTSPKANPAGKSRLEQAIDASRRGETVRPGAYTPPQAIVPNRYYRPAAVGAEPAQSQKPTEKPRKATLYDMTIGSIKRGYDNAVYGRELYKDMTGQENQADEYAQKMAGDEYNFEAGGFLSRALSGGMELLGQQVRQWTDPLSVGLAGTAATGAAIAGQAGPQVLVPEEVITVPGAFLAGLQVGSTKANFEIEAGHAYKEMLDNGISEETASKIATGVGIGNAALEFVQLDELAKSFKILDKIGADDSIIGAVKRELTRRGVNIAKETAQEVAQEGVTIAGTQIGSKIDTGKWAYNSGDVLGRLGDTAASSALSFGALNVPGGAYNVYQQTSGKDTQNAGGKSAEDIGATFQEMGDDVVLATIQEGLASDPSTNSYQIAQQLQQKRANGEQITNMELGRLYRANVVAIDAETEHSQNDAETVNDVPESTRTAIEMLVNGEQISGNQAARIAQNQDAVALLSRLTGTEIDTDAPLSRVKSDIRSLASRSASVSTDAGTAVASQTLQGRTTAEAAYDMSRVRAAASSLGENGAKALTASYDGSVSADAFYAGFASYYEAGVSGMDMGKVRSEYGAQLSAAQKYAAYVAGRNDAELSLQRERQAAPYAKSAGSDSGLVYDNFVRQAVESGRVMDDVNGETRVYLTAETAAKINGVAKSLGVRVQFVDSVRGGTANAQISGSTVLVERNNPNPVMAIVGHEMTHRMQELAPKEYRAFRDIVSQEEQSGIQRRIDAYAAQGVELTYEQAMDEVAADYAGRMIDDGKVLDDFIEKHRDDRTLLEKVRDAIRAIVRKLTGAEKKQAQTAEGKLTAALEAAAKQAENLETNKNAAQTDGETKFSIKRTSQMTLAQQLKMFYDGKMASSDAFYFGETPAVLEKSGFDALPLAMTIGDFRKSTQTKHNIPRRVLKNLMNNLADPLFSFGSGERAGIILDDIDGDGHKLLAALERGTNMDRKPVNVINSLYGLEHPAEWLKNQIDSGNEFVLYDEKRANAFLQTYGYSASVGDGIRSMGESVTQNSTEVKTKFSLKSPVEETENLIALHNLTEEKLWGDLRLGGFPMPSIAVTRTDVPHTNFGDITLVMDKRSIDPKANRKNTVYSADAWTPTFPQVEYAADPAAERRISGRLRELSGKVDEMFRQDLYRITYDMEDLLNRYGGEDGLLRQVMDNYGLKAAYLEDAGHHVSAATVQREADKGYSQDRVEKYRAIVETLGTDDPDEIGHIPLKELRDRYGDELETAFPGMTKSTFRLSGIIRQVQAYLQDQGGEPVYETVADAAATRRAIDDALDRDGYERWVRELYSGVQADSGIYNNKERFTPAGNRRTFKQTHYPVTLENIVKAMKGQNGGNTKNVSGFYGVKSLRAGTAKRFKSIADMHKLEGRLQNLTEEQTKAIHDELDRRLMDITEALAEKSPNGKGSFDYYLADSIGNMLVEIADGEIYTIDAIMGKFNGEYGFHIGNELAAQVRDLLFDVSQMPVNIFEAKPERAVGFDEVLAAVLPDDASGELRDALSGRGVNVLTYKAGDDADRIAKVNGVEGARFSLKEDTVSKNYAAILEENELLREQMKDYIDLQRRNGKLQESRDYWQGQTRRTKRVTTDKKAVSRAARELIRSYGADLDAGDIAQDLQSLYDYLASGYDGKDELTYTEARRRAEAIAEKLVGNAVAVDETYEQYSDLRAYLRSTTLSLSEEDSRDIPDYGDWRKHQMGRMVIRKGHTNIDQVYQEMSELWPEFFDEQRENNPVDQLLRIAEVMDGIYNAEEYNPFGPYMQQAITGAANEIMERFFDLPQTRATFADRQARKLDDTKAKGRERVQKVREDAAAKIAKANADGKAAVEDARLADDMYYGRKAVELKRRNADRAEKVRAQRDARLAELRRQNRERTAKAVERERTRRVEQIGKLKQRHREKDAAGRERRSARELRAKIMRHASALSQKLLRPSDKQHIPESLRQAVAAMLESINLESAYTTDPNTGKRVKDGSGTPTKRTEAFRALKEQYEAIRDGKTDFTGVLDPELVDNLAELIKAKDTPLSDMSTAQLATVWNTLKAVEASVSSANKLFHKGRFSGVEELAYSIQDSSRGKRAKNNYGGNGLGKVSGFGDQLLNVDMLNPLTFLHLFGMGGDALYHELQEARDRKTEIMEHTAELVQDVIGKADISAMQEKTHTFQVSGGEITLSTAQLMSLYELTKREQAQDHIYKGGLRPTEQKRASNLLGKLENPPDGVKVDPGDVSRMLSALTEQETKIADGLQAIMQGYLADEGNQESMKVFGYRKFTEEHYFPISSDPNHVQSKIGDILDGGVKRPVSVAEWGSAKGTTKGANNGLLLGDIFDVFAQHAVDMSTYASHLGALEDVNRVRNFTFRNEEGDRTGQMKSIIQRVAGQHGNAYLDKLLQDISRGTAKGGVTGLSRLTANYKAASVGLNLRVALQQPTSYARTLAVMDGKYLADPRVMKMGGWEKALKYAPIARWKDWGNFEVNQGRQFQDILFGTDSKLERARNASMKLASAMDSLTWGRIWNACELETADLRRDLTRGSEAFYRAVAQRFTDVVDQTQVVDNVLGRSQFMRSGDNLAKMASSYMGEPTQSYNLFYRAYRDAVQEQNPTKRRQAAKRMGRAAGALVFSMFLNAVAQSLWDAVRDDDDRDEKYWERVLGHILPNFAQNVNPMGMVPYLRDVLSILQGYDVERMDLAAVTGLAQAARGMQKALNGEGRYTVIGAGANLVAELSRVVGLPVPTVKRDVLAIARSMGIETGDWYFQYQIERAINSLGYSGNRKEFYDIAFGALSAGELDVYQKITADMMAGGVKASSIEAAMRDRLEAARTEDPAFTLTQRAKDLIGTSERYGHEEKTQAGFGAGDLDPAAYARYNAQRAETYRTWANELEQSAGFRRMNDAGKDKALDAAEKLAKHLALIEHSGGQVAESDLSQWERWATNGEAWGVDPTEAILFKAAYDMSESDKDEAGKTISGSKKENTLEAAAELLPGLTDEELEYLMSNFWKPEDRELSEMRERGFMP